jgi:hypothetical protein
MKKISTMQAFSNEILKGAKANDRCGSRGSLVVLLCFR